MAGEQAASGAYVTVPRDALLAVLNAHAQQMHHPCKHDHERGWSCHGYGEHVAALWQAVGSAPSEEGA